MEVIRTVGQLLVTRTQDCLIAARQAEEAHNAWNRLVAQKTPFVECAIDWQRESARWSARAIAARLDVSDLAWHCRVNGEHMSVRHLCDPLLPND